MTIHLSNGRSYTVHTEAELLAFLSWYSIASQAA